MALYAHARQTEPALHPSGAALAEPDRHIVDVLIEERAGRLRDYPLLWSTVKQLLYPLLKYRDAIAMADALGALPGHAALTQLSGRLKLDVRVQGLEHVPARGPIFICANHPTGIADGIAVFDALTPLRPDFSVMANRDAIRVADGFADVVIPVDWRKDYRTKAKTRETLISVAEAVRRGRAVVIFPSGRLAHLTWRGLRERPWLATTLSLARKHAAPIVPLHIGGRNSWLYYALALVSNELRDITVFNEFLNKGGYPYRLTFGAPIDPCQLPADHEAATAALQRFVEHELPAGRAFPPAAGAADSAQGASGGSRSVGMPAR